MCNKFLEVQVRTPAVLRRLTNVEEQHTGHIPNNVAYGLHSVVFFVCIVACSGLQF